MKRQIVRIDQEKCDGCGLCVGACAEGAIQLVNGKAVLVRDDYCDGLGACLGDCPQGAITLEERDAAAFDPEAVAQHLSGTSGATAHAGSADARATAAHGHHHTATVGCPGHAAFSFGTMKAGEAAAAAQDSELCQWPIQLHLVPTIAPYWEGADILLAADCTAFALGGFHSELLRGRRLIIACPKLDDTEGYVEKLAAILSNNGVRKLTVARMEVPCCGGLTRIAERALAEAGKPVFLKTVTIGVQGGIR